MACSSGLGFQSQDLYVIPWKPGKTLHEVISFRNLSIPSLTTVSFAMCSACALHLFYFLLSSSPRLCSLHKFLINAVLWLTAHCRSPFCCVQEGTVRESRSQEVIHHAALKLTTPYLPYPVCPRPLEITLQSLFLCIWENIPLVLLWSV